MADNRQIAKEIIDAAGGQENILSAAHCATRLRIMVKDKEKIDQKRVEEIEKVKGAFFNSGQYQVILGTGTVNKIYEEVIGLGIGSSTKSEQAKEAAQSGTVFQRAIRSSGMFLCPSFLLLSQLDYSWVCAVLLCRNKSWLYLV